MLLLQKKKIIVLPNAITIKIINVEENSWKEERKFSFVASI